MFGITRRDYWAFCAGLAANTTLVGYLCNAATMFLLGAVLLCWDIYMYLETRKEGK